jgi:phosphotriesterase-related protein
MSKFSGKVQTVLGPIEPATLGLTLTHEHLLIDAVGSRPSPAVTASDRAKWREPLALSNYYDQRRNIHLYRDNLRLVSVDEAVQEGIHFKAAGGGGLVDATSVGLARDPVGLATISRRAGIHVVMGAGFYTVDYHPERIESMSEEEIRDEIVRDVVDGVPDPSVDSGIVGLVRESRDWASPGIQAGIIGEVGLSWPVHPNEEKVLRAAAMAQGVSGAAVSIHPGRNPEAPITAARIVEDAGGDLSRTIVGHLDRTIFSIEGLRELAKTGCVMEFDLFGWQESFYPLASVDLPNDATRVNYLVSLAEDGYLESLVISHDIDVRVRFRQFGGEGWEHIPLRIVPLMRRKGFSQKDVDQITVGNPSRLLTIS